MDPTAWDAPVGVVVLALFVIVMFRANGTYWLGRLAARGAQRTRAARLMDSPRYARAVERVNRWGAPVVTASFLTMGFQTMVLLAAGATAMPQSRFLPAVTVGSVIWALVYATVGFVGLEALGLLWALSPALTLLLTAVLVAGVAASLVARRRRPEAEFVDSATS